MYKNLYLNIIGINFMTFFFEDDKLGFAAVIFYKCLLFFITFNKQYYWNNIYFITKTHTIITYQ